MMTLPRPLPKELLKKMFLKVLYEHRKGGKYEHHGHDHRGIVHPRLQEFFHIDPGLTQDEQANGIRAVFELERDGFIMQDQLQSSPNFKVLSERGKGLIDADIEDMVLPSIDIDALLTDTRLRNRIHDDYLLGDFESCVFKAFKLLEERVRAKAGQPPTALGSDLMSKAFRDGAGILRHPGALSPAEEQGLHHLMKGAIMLFKNPSSHRTVEYSDETQTAFVLCFANMLLKLTDETVGREKT